MSVTEVESDFDRSTQMLHRHGFFLSPVDPDKHEDAVCYGYGLRSVAPENNMRGSVKWEDDIIPPLPFTKATRSQCLSSQGELPSLQQSTRRHNTGETPMTLGKGTFSVSIPQRQREFSEEYPKDSPSKSLQQQKLSM